LLRPSDGRLIARIANPHSGVMGDLAFTPDSRRLLITESNNLARIWDLAHVRGQLAELQLDWEAPAFPPAPPARPAHAFDGSGALRRAGEAMRSLRPDGR
jgi:WD40 repeat protein